MSKKNLIFILIFYVLALVQTSFLARFSVFNIIPNFILIAVILLALFEKSKNYSGIFSAFSGGFFLDIFSDQFIGFHVLMLLALAFFIKIILRKYVWTPAG